MSASFFKPSLISCSEINRLRNDRGLVAQKKNESLIKPLFASICFLMCIFFVPERPDNLASICQKYHSSVACEVW